MKHDIAYEKNRIDDVLSYSIINSEPSIILDDITNLASLLYDVPISLITILDEEIQWFLSKKGLEVNSSSIENSFCQYTLNNANEVLVINDLHKDQRFKNNPFVAKEPNIKFYAGAPLKTPEGNVLGTLCVIDTKPREFSENQKKALEILAKKAMVYIENYKTIKYQDQKIKSQKINLKKITNQIPIGIYQLKVLNTGIVEITFLSKEIYSLYSNVNIDDIRESPWKYFRFINKQDVSGLISKWLEANQSLNAWEGEFRTVDHKWHYTLATPERMKDGTTLWYGYIKDISEKMEYLNTLEQILFDISHVLRKPVTNLTGLSDMLQQKKLKPAQIKELSGHINTVSKELETFTHKLNDVYYLKHENLKK